MAADNVYDSEFSLIIVIVLYTVSFSVSTSFQNSHSWNPTCNPVIPYGKCLAGDNDAKFIANSSWYIVAQWAISLVITVLAGTWSDSHGRRRKPLIFIPIIGQIVRDGINILGKFWYWPSSVEAILTTVLSGLFVGRNLFWIGVLAYVSENSKKESRTQKLGIIIATYTISVLIGWGISALLNMSAILRRNEYAFFILPALMDCIALLVGNFYVKDHSDSYNKKIVWLRPKYLFKSYLILFKYRMKGFAVMLVVLIICQSILVARIGGQNAISFHLFKTMFRMGNMEYVYFTVIKTMTMIFGMVFAVSVLSRHLKIDDLLIVVVACSFDTVAAICYSFITQSWQIYFISIIDLFCGTAVVIITSLTSKMVKNEELGRLNSVQTVVNSLVSIGVVKAYEAIYYGIYYSKYCDFSSSVILINVILTLPLIFVFKVIYAKHNTFWINDPNVPRQHFTYVITSHN